MSLWGIVDQSRDIRGKVVAITGGARGIGLAIATRLQQQGANVAIGDVDEAEAIETGRRLGLRLACRLDVTKRILDVNAYGPILGSKLAAARMHPRGRGHVINIASASGLMPVPGIATYSATKHAVLGFTEAIRLENRTSGIQFSAVLRSLTATQMIDGVGLAKGFKNIQPDDVAKVVADLIRRPKPRVVVPRSFGIVALAGRRFMPRPASEVLERVLGAERVFQDDVDVARRTEYEKRTGLS